MSITLSPLSTQFLSRMIISSYHCQSSPFSVLNSLPSISGSLLLWIDPSGAHLYCLWILYTSYHFFNILQMSKLTFLMLKYIFICPFVYLDHTSQFLGIDHVSALSSTSGGFWILCGMLKIDCESGPQCIKSYVNKFKSYYIV